jgi:hypothetical protein
MNSATIPLWDAWGVAIDAGQAPPADLTQPRFYRGKVQGTPPPGYYLFGQGIPGAGDLMNGQDGEDGEWTIHCWAATPDGALRLYAWLKGILHNVPLAVVGYGTVAGVVDGAGPTPDAKLTGYQVIARYTAEPIEQAA